MAMGLVAGVAENFPGYRDARGYRLGYDTQQTPFEVAKERGLAGVAGGFVDQLTGGMTDLDKRGQSKKQQDTKNFLNKFVYGTQGVAGRDNASEIEKQKDFDFEMARQKGFNPASGYGMI